jgi:hypothetical protein
MWEREKSRKDPYYGQSREREDLFLSEHHSHHHNHHHHHTTWYYYACCSTSYVRKSPQQDKKDAPRFLYSDDGSLPPSLSSGKTKLKENIKKNNKIATGATSVWIIEREKRDLTKKKEDKFHIISQYKVQHKVIYAVVHAVVICLVCLR